jgi:ADP-ribose pyrophosphatase YjhB (NUDIX family)
MKPLWYSGANPVVDLLIVRTHPEDGLQVLLIQRSKDAEAEASKWALPGGFVNTNAEKFSSWSSGSIKEIPVDAAVRECAEETGLNVSLLKQYIKPVGVYSGGGRDPRDSDIDYTESHAFFLSLDGLMSISNSNKVAGFDDAQNAAWKKWSNLGKLEVAFDHLKICQDASRFVDASWPNFNINKKQKR